MRQGTRTLIVSACALLPVQPAAAQSPGTVQEALLRAKPAVVLVVAETSTRVALRCDGLREASFRPPAARASASGWLVAADGWVVTSADVLSVPSPGAQPALLQAAVRQVCLPDILQARGLRPGERPDIEDAIVRRLAAAAAPSARVQPEVSATVVLASGAQLPGAVRYAPESRRGMHVALIKVDASAMPTLPLAGPSPPRIGDRVHVIGFPAVLQNHELLGTATQAEASITTGAVSGFGQDIAGRPVIQIDAATEAGQSGGPVLDGHGAVAGVVAFDTSPGSRDARVSGFTFVIPSAAVRAMLGEAGVLPGRPGPFDIAWQAALSDFFAGRHRRAAAHLRQAEQLVPGMPDVRRLATENEQRRRAQPLLPWDAVGFGMLAVSGAGWIVLLLRRWRRGRFRITPAEAAHLLAASEPPVVLDVRDADAYARSPVRIRGALHLPPAQIASGRARLPVPTTRPVVAYCT